ncbi:hypothetical protein ABIB73_007434 [Bradyrhizobium sp. F1.4.3]|uniref:AMP-binding protein n=1 Tax=Bradyrhizobium sp. F1.4.3 TaxID=3156356 RepID=UPI0033988592
MAAAIADRVAATLQHSGVLPAQAIAISGANSLEYTAVFVGALRAGATVAPLPTSAAPEQLARMVPDSGARSFFADDSAPAFDTGEQRVALDGLVRGVWCRTGCCRRARDWTPSTSNRTGPSTSSIHQASRARPRQCLHVAPEGHGCEGVCLRTFEFSNDHRGRCNASQSNSLAYKRSRAASVGTRFGKIDGNLKPKR